MSARGRAARRDVGTRSKYGAIKTTVDGFRFDSKAEARYYGVLLLRGKMGGIRNLELQPRFPLIVNGVKVATYVADFRYEELRDVSFGGMPKWCDCVDDVKGFDTPVSRLKRKLVQALWGIAVQVRR